MDHGWIALSLKQTYLKKKTLSRKKWKKVERMEHGSILGPARTPANASAMPLLAPPHDSGPMWFAKPSSYGSFIHYTLPVSRRFRVRHD
jgi:hypothetical protein